MEINKIYTGNNIDILKTFPDNSIDSIVTDPPYGLGKEPNAVEVLQSWITTGYHEISGKGFMGKEWDSFVPQPIFWKECYRVLKPGGHLLSFAGTRTYDWMVMGLRLAGFEIRDLIAFLYSTDEVFNRFSNSLNSDQKKLLQMALGNENLYGYLYGSGFPKSLDISKAIDKSMGAEREVVGEDSRKALKENTLVNFGMGFGKWDITAPATPEAKQWQGWGTALKPALEPIVMARKPLDGTVAGNVLKHGVGGINIDGCRVDFVSEEDKKGSLVGFKSGKIQDTNINFNASPLIKAESVDEIIKGRFPANVIHDGSDEVVSLFPNTGNGNGGEVFSYNGKEYDNKNTSMFNGDKPQSPSNFNDSGSAARFFYTAKASQNERNFGLYGFEDSVTTDGRIKPIDNAFNRGETQRKNIHPTVKPLELMRYLVRLVTPKGGICLDPFMGSGTTAVACKAEKFDYIGCELEPEYVKIAEARIKAEVVMFDIFDFGA
jgi:site-specific DNA-methyltransferase (adenine-specific)